MRRYAWSTKLPISILTDFEEFAVYACNNKPDISDKASIGPIKYLTYNIFLKEFDFIWDSFSKEKVLKGGFDKYVLSDSNKKGTTTVDKAFLVSLDEWRKELAQNIALRNTTFNEDKPKLMRIANCCRLLQPPAPNRCCLPFLLSCNNFIVKLLCLQSHYKATWSAQFWSIENQLWQIGSCILLLSAHNLAKLLTFASLIIYSKMVHSLAEQPFR